jgi:GT2 family glycosyltransferase
MKYAFVILHYNVIQETLDCVKSILEKTHKEVSIIIVDNASANGSGKTLAEHFAGNQNIKIILNKKNLGFANGNNEGIYYAKDVLKADFVIVLNNDTYLIQDDFLDVIEDEWNYSHFAVLGPKIYTFNGKNQNPIPHKIENKAQVDYWIRHHKFGLIRTYLCIDELWHNFKKFIKKILNYKNSQVKQKEPLDEIRQEDVALHGCCFVFSPKFFEFFKGFDTRTFMYEEENILYNHVKNKKLLMVYNPKLKIFHAEKAATKSATKNFRKRKIFIYKEGIKSLKILKEVLTT